MGPPANYYRIIILSLFLVLTSAQESGAGGVLGDRKGREDGASEARDPVEGTRGLSILGRCTGRLVPVGGAKAERFRGVTGTEAT